MEELVGVRCDCGFALGIKQRDLDEIQCGVWGIIPCPKCKAHLNDKIKVLAAVVRIVRTKFAEAKLAVTFAEYADESGVELTKIEVEANLDGKIAVQNEDEIGETLAKELGDEIANRFMIVVR